MRDYQVLKQRSEERGDGHQPPRLQIFRYEDYTASFAAFHALLKFVTRGAVTHADAEASFALPRINRHRPANRPNPHDTYRGWSEAERLVFDIILSATGLRRFAEVQLGYVLPAVERSVELAVQAPDSTPGSTDRAEAQRTP
jgi:hypothetical protein